MPSDDYRWLAHYSDGSTYPEHGPDGEARGWKSVDQSRVVAVEIVPQKPHMPDLKVNLQAGDRAVFFRRRTVTVAFRGAVQRQSTITVLGWETDDETGLWAVYPDGEVLVTSDKQAIQ